MSRRGRDRGRGLTRRATLGSATPHPGKVTLLTNVASKCGYTDMNYEGLTRLRAEYGGRVEIVGVPSNAFGKQEPGSPDEIKAFVESKFKVAFPLTEKCEVNGPNTHPLFLEHKRATNSLDKDVKWNFETKFLIAKDGVSVQRFAKAFGPEKLRGNIEELVNAPDAA